MAAFRGMHVSPMKHSYAWLPRKCDYQQTHTHTHTHRQTDRQTPDKVISMCCYASQVTQKVIHMCRYASQATQKWLYQTTPCRMWQATLIFRPHKNIFTDLSDFSSSYNGIMYYSIIWENRTASGPHLKFGFHSSLVFRKPRFLGRRTRSGSVIHNTQHFTVHIIAKKCVNKWRYFQISYNIFLFIHDILLKFIKSKLNKTFSIQSKLCYTVSKTVTQLVSMQTWSAINTKERREFWLFKQ